MPIDRRSFLTACTSAGVASTLFPGVLFALAAQGQESASTDQSKPPKITPEMIDQAAIIAGIGPFTDEQKKMMIDGIVDRNGSIKAIRKLHLPNSAAPCIVFQPMPAARDRSPRSIHDLVLAPKADTASSGITGWTADRSVTVPREIEDLAFASVSVLASLLSARKITSVD